MKYRHEWKHEINFLDQQILLSRLKAVMKQDSHCINGTYEIRSLYFDTPKDSALFEKIDGVNCREKFRIRYYNKDTSYMILEKKGKINGLCHKESCPISLSEVRSILNGDLGWMLESERPLCIELYSKMKSSGLKPKTIVDYTRYPFTYPAGNVRVTIDFDIRTNMFPHEFLNPNCLTLPIEDSPKILEVKWDEYLPDIIKDVVSLTGRRVCAFSKYAQARMYK
ncbi:MAG: polyphosphate polymerase domain-containing protein [Firmicutes bacterium]|nr:polyphosphate polymerase domain-containing protein [Bacillota bacterium]